MILEVPFHDKMVYCNIWKVAIGRINLYLMDTDIDLNDEFYRSITYNLYGGDWENRMKQEYLLGVGGILLLKKLGIKKDVYHLNEGHAALINAQRLCDYMNDEKLSFYEALEMVRATSLYTVILLCRPVTIILMNRLSLNICANWWNRLVFLGNNLWISDVKTPEAMKNSL